MANRLRWKRRGLIAHARSERVLSEFQDGVASVAETHKSVELGFWVQLPGNSPPFPRPIWLGHLLHMERVLGSSPRETTILIPIGVVGSARLLDMEKVIGSNPISETILHRDLIVV